MKDRKILIVGGNSAIAFEVARLLAEKGASLYLLGRDTERLERNVQDLQVRTEGKVGFAEFEASDTASHKALWEQADQEMGGLNGLLVAQGWMGEQEQLESDFEQQKELFEVNFLGAISFLTYAAEKFAQQKDGLIAAISSPAGDRGRKKNYVYGAAKGALTRYMSGLRQRLHGSNVNVLTIKPGFVSTPMTEGLKLPLVAQPEVVARDIVEAMEKGRDELYTPFFWRYIMTIIKNIPEVIFKRMSV